MKKDVISIILIIIVLIIVVLVPIGVTISSYCNEREIEITIKDKYVKNESESGKYLVVDENNNTYEITDMLFKGKFNSTDLYNQLEINRTYKVKVTGYRINIISMYPNINEIVEEIVE